MSRGDAYAYYDDPPLYTTLARRGHTARKQHRCSACGQPIPAGERYTTTVIIDDDERKLVAYKEHIVCPWEEGHP